MSNPKVVRGASVLTVALLALTGCTFGQGSAGSSTSTGSSTPATSSSPAPSIALETVQTFSLKHLQGLALALTPKAAFIAVAPSAGINWNRVMRLDLSTGKQEVVAKSQWGPGAIHSVAASGNWVVWVDQSDTLPAGAPAGGLDVLWRVWAKNLKNGHTILLDSNGSQTDPMPPVLVSGDGYVGWAHYDPSNALMHQMVWKVGDARARAVPLKGSSALFKHFGGASAIAGGLLVFALPASTKVGRKYSVGDCWSYPLDGGKAQQLTQSGLVQSCYVSGTDLVWTEHIDPATNSKGAVLGAADNPYEIKTVSLDGTSQPRTIHEGDMVGNPVVGNGFVLWTQGRPIQVSALGSTASTTFKGGPYVWAGAVSGDLVAYPGLGKKAGTVTVIRVIESGS